MPNHSKNGAGAQKRNRLKHLVVPGAVILLITLGWYLVIQERQSLLQTTLSANAPTELEEIIAQIRFSFIIMSLGTLAALVSLVVWTHGTIKQEQANKAIADSQVLYQSLVNTLPRRIYRKDKQNRFVFGNQPFLDEVGQSLNEIVGKTDFDLYPDEIAAKHQL